MYRSIRRTYIHTYIHTVITIYIYIYIPADCDVPVPLAPSDPAGTAFANDVHLSLSNKV